jgi:hypothetical protein
MNIKIVLLLGEKKFITDKLFKLLNMQMDFLISLAKLKYVYVQSEN